MKVITVTAVVIVSCVFVLIGFLIHAAVKGQSECDALGGVRVESSRGMVCVDAKILLKEKP